MKIKTLIPFLVILLLLLGLAVWQKSTEKKPAPIAEQAGLARLVPENLSKSTLDRIELFSGSAPEDKVVLKKKGDLWQIASLYDAPAENSAVNDFVDKLLSLKGEPRATADDDVKRGNYALNDHEAFRVQAWLASGDTPAMDILVGKSADFRTVFIRQAGDSKVFVESNNLRREAGAGETESDSIPKSNKWLKSKFMDIEADQIESLSISYPDKEFAFERKEIQTEEAAAEEEDAVSLPDSEPAYEWKLSNDPGIKEVKETEIASILSRFATITATDVADPEEKAACGFEPPQFTATFGMANGEDVVIHGGRSADGDKYYLQQAGLEPPLVYEVAKHNFEQIFVQGSKLFMLPQWDVEEEDIVKLSLTRPDGTVLIEKEEDNWKIVEPVLALEQQATALKAMAAAVSSVKAIDFASPGADGTAMHTTLKITLANGTERTLQFGDASRAMNGRYLRFDNSDQTLVITKADSERLLPPVRDLFSLAVLDLNPNQLTALSVVNKEQNLSLRKDPESKRWSGLFNGKAISPGLDKIEDYVMTLNAFQMDSFSLDQSASDVTADMSFTFEFEDGNSQSMVFSNEKDGTTEAAVSWIPYRFTVTPLELLRIMADMDTFQEPETEEAVVEEEEAVIETEEAAAAEEEAVVELTVSDEAVNEEIMGEAVDQVADDQEEAPEASSEETLTIEVQ